MITGHVLNYQPVIHLTVYGPNGQQDTFETVIDTGFTGYLTLPEDEVLALGLPFISFYATQLADGNQVRLTVHEATIIWHGARRTVFVLAMGMEPLLGMSVIYGSQLLLEGKDGGQLSLEELL